MADGDIELRVDAHVLVQLGSELVTDVEQAILECVKNAYDADSPGCKIEIDTRETGVEIDEDFASKLQRFDQSTETVEVSFEKVDSKRPKGSSASQIEQRIRRNLNYIGRITIEDRGAGMSTEQLKNAWLVISKSGKRSEPGAVKRKTPKGRTPLGDKGLGRLGSMKLGDILRVETATDPKGKLSSVHFRWADCDMAGTIDQIPVHLEERENGEKFKGTRVSVLGLKDIGEWRRSDRITEIAKSLAKLVSPFEAKSSFPVGIVLDGVEQSLVAVTDEMLTRAVAEFNFSWKPDANLGAGGGILEANARFKKRLFMSERTKAHKERTDLVFGSDHGKGFAAYLPTHKRLLGYRQKFDIDGPWFAELKHQFKWSDLKPDSGSSIADPGAFEAAFYYFHLDDLDHGAVAGVPIDKAFIKSMTGISILRDGFRIRSQGDWLELSSGMTSGSTYNLRVENTIGYFSLTGAENFRLVEKSDREGFVEDSTFRGFMEIARKCKDFSNDTLEHIRRALDEYAKAVELPEATKKSKTIETSFGDLEASLRAAKDTRDAAEKISADLDERIRKLERDAKGAPAEKTVAKAMQLATHAVKAIRDASSALPSGGGSEIDLRRIQHELTDRNEQAIALLEGAAVGLSARGIAHELRTHLTEIRHRAASLEKSAKSTNISYEAVAQHVRAIKSACGAISNAAALIDPMLPKARALRETIDMRTFIESFVADRANAFERRKVKPIVSGSGITVRANRSRLIQVVDNLVQNGFYWLTRSEAPVKEIRFTMTRTGLTVSDSGPGVDPHYEESLFEIFVSAKPDRARGQGLGLFIAQQLLRLDGCDIELLGDRNSHGNRYKFAIDLSAIAKV